VSSSRVTPVWRALGQARPALTVEEVRLQEAVGKVGRWIDQRIEIEMAARRAAAAAPEPTAAQWARTRSILMPR
jgi:hypothetical protein